MRIDYVISGLGTGGAETMLFRLLEHGPALRSGRVIALNSGGALAERFRSLGLRVVCLDMSASAPNPAAFARLVAILRCDRPDVVSTWMYHADLIGGLAARAAGVPVVWGIRNSTLGPETRRTTRAVVWLCARLSRHLPSRIISCSERAREIHESLGYDSGRFRVIPNGFDLSRFRPSLEARASVRNELGVSDAAPLVGLIARLDPQKNHLGFVRAAGKVHNACPDVRFVMVGSGITTQNDRLMRAVRAGGLEACVSLLGERSDVPRLMAALDVLVSSSLGEAFPNVVGEAMACAVPCVVTDVGDSAALVGDAGIVVPPGQDDALAAAVMRLLAPGSERVALGGRARARVQSRFSIQSAVKRYAQVFGEAVEGHRGGSGQCNTEDAR